MCGMPHSIFLNRIFQASECEMAEYSSYHRDWRRYTIALALTLVVIGTTVPAFPAASASSAQIKAIPHESRQDIGTFITLEMKFSLDTGNPISTFQVTVDPGTPGQKILKFNTQGQILPGSDPIFKGISGSIKFKNNGYYGPSSIEGMFMTKLLKSLLTAGTHQVTFEILSGSNVLASANNDFILKPSPHAGKANLQALALFSVEKVNGEHGGHQHVHAIAIAGNNGTKASGGFQTALYLSTIPTLDPSAQLLDTKHIGSISPGDIRAIVFNENLHVAKGTYYLIVQLDSTNVVSETHKDDNTQAVKLIIS